jgi:hypothetical protein
LIHSFSSNSASLSVRVRLTSTWRMRATMRMIRSIWARRSGSHACAVAGLADVQGLAGFAAHQVNAGPGRQAGGVGLAVERPADGRVDPAQPRFEQYAQRGAQIVRRVDPDGMNSTAGPHDAPPLQETQLPALTRSAPGAVAKAARPRR